MSSQISSGTIKIKNSKNEDVSFLPRTDISCVKNSAEGTTLSEMIAEYSQMAEEAVNNGGVSIMHEEPTESNTESIVPKSLIGAILPFTNANASVAFMKARIVNQPVYGFWVAGDVCEIEYKVVNLGVSDFEGCKLTFNGTEIWSGSLDSSECGTLLARYTIKGSDISQCMENETQLEIASVFSYASPDVSVSVSVPSVFAECIPDTSKTNTPLTVTLKAAGFRSDNGNAAPVFNICSSTLTAADPEYTTTKTVTTSDYTYNSNATSTTQYYNYANLGYLNVVISADGAGNILEVTDRQEMEVLWPYPYNTGTTEINVSYPTEYGIITIRGYATTQTIRSNSYGGNLYYPNYVNFSNLTITRDILYKPQFSIKTTVTNMPSRGYFRDGETIEYKTEILNDSTAFYSSPLTITETDLRSGSTTVHYENIEPRQTFTMYGSKTLTQADILDNLNVGISVSVEGETAFGDDASKTESTIFPVVDPNLSLRVYCTETSTPAGGNGYAAGEQVAFSLSIQNDGNITLSNIAVSDAGGFSRTISSLAPNESVSLTDSGLKFSATSDTRYSIETHAPTITVPQISGFDTDIRIFPVNALLAVRKEFVFTIDVYYFSMDSFLFQRNESNPVYVDWGDGTKTVYSGTSSIFHSYDHSSGNSNVHQIRVAYGDWTQVQLSSSSITSYFEGYTISIDSSIPRIASTDFYSIFKNCTMLRSVHKDVFKENAAYITSFYRAFYNCTSLASIPSDLFSGCSTASSMDSCFYQCTSLTSIPSSLFSSCTSVTTFYECFGYCTSLTSIPSNLFSTNTAATIFSYCFDGCSSLASIPSGLFTNCSGVAGFIGTFYQCTGLQTLQQSPFINCTASASFAYCFYRCTALESIPSNLFSGCSNATSFSYCFSGCSKLQSIPAGIFSGCSSATDFSYCFSGCTSLTSISSNLFSGCSGATTFTYCFQNCTGLQTIDTSPFNECLASASAQYCFSGCTGLQTITGNVFNGCSNFITFYYCFQNCTGLQTITGNVFNGCSGDTSFIYCFYGCSSLTSIPSALFSGCSGATSFSYCFYGCSSLTSIPSALFSGCSGATSFSYCFSNCTSLASIPANLFSGCSSVTTFNYCFSNCTGLQTIATSPFNGCLASATAQYCFSNCSNLQTITGSIFNNCSNFTSFNNCFYNCGRLTSIPSTLFSGCSGVTNLGSCFYNCSMLASVPSNLFSSCTAVTTVASCFYNCGTLQIVPTDLFSYSTALTNITSALRYCSSIGDFSLRFTARNITSYNYFLGSISSTYTAGNRIIYVPSGSTTASYINSYKTIYSSLGLTVVEE